MVRKSEMHSWFGTNKIKKINHGSLTPIIIPLMVSEDLKSIRRQGKQFRNDEFNVIGIPIVQKLSTYV